MTLDSIINEINNAKTLVILTHMNPDGDAIGSSLALYCSLLKLKKDVDVIVPEHSSIYNFLPRINDLKKEPTKAEIRKKLQDPNISTKEKNRLAELLYKDIEFK